MKNFLAYTFLLFCSYTLLSAESIEQPKQQFILVTMLYNETNYERVQEYITCLKYNKAHDRIANIHVIYDTSKDTEHNNLILDYLKQENITTSYVSGRVSYGYCFNLVNALYPNQAIILSNADIYFNETLNLLDSYDLSEVFLALTRWNILANGKLEIFKQYAKDGSFWPLSSATSQDVWIFKSPLRSFNDDTIVMGTMQCDSRIAYQAHMSGLRVLNPCLSLQCCHLHLSDIRNYDIKDRYTLYHLMMAVEWSYL